MVKYLMVSLGGVLGANARFLLGSWVLTKTAGKTVFPWGTFWINVSGSFLLGLFMTLAILFRWHDNWKLFCAVGFLGAYTTFSTFEYESIKLLLDGHTGQAFRNIIGSVVVGLVAVWLGILLARQIGNFRPISGKPSF